jgi:hypothetical protein
MNKHIQETCTYLVLPAVVMWEFSREQSWPRWGFLTVLRILLFTKQTTAFVFKFIWLIPTSAVADHAAINRDKITVSTAKCFNYASELYIWRACVMIFMSSYTQYEKVLWQRGDRSREFGRFTRFRPPWIKKKVVGIPSICMYVRLTRACTIGRILFIFRIREFTRHRSDLD